MPIIIATFAGLFEKQDDKRFLNAPMRAQARAGGEITAAGNRDAAGYRIIVNCQSSVDIPSQGIKACTKATCLIHLNKIIQFPEAMNSIVLKYVD